MVSEHWWCQRYCRKEAVPYPVKSGFNGVTKKRSLRVSLVLDAFRIPYEQIDISSPLPFDAKEVLKSVNALNDTTVYLPQIFNDENYCGVKPILT
ncbi:unnamed protein product [Soboliphyme baturini]|uniref:GST N-terminal domain-containing protein n=1 Tax=Soboliphyme baturini TaxID=241478 RepID=A0A183J0S9_9BILA|nr:unnamed protein product [Soboliphyme baturini]